MKKFLTKKVLAVVTVVSLMTTMGAVAYADSALKKIQAYQNANIAIEVGGKSVDLSSEDGTMYPIIYDGHSYVSAKAVAEALGATVQWDNDRQAVVITPAGGTPPNVGIPNKDNTTTQPVQNTHPTQPTPKPTPAPADSSAPSSSTNGSSFSDAVKLGSSFTYKDEVNYKPGTYDTNSVQYTVAVKKVTPISLDAIEGLGFKRPDSDTAKVEYVMVDLSVKVKNATMKKGSEGLGYSYLSSFTPHIWGVKAESGDSIIGGTDYGFDGSLDSNTDDVLTDFPKVNPGDSKSYEVTGKVLLPIIKGQESYLIIEKRDSSLEYDSRLIHFKLK